MNSTSMTEPDRSAKRLEFLRRSLSDERLGLERASTDAGFRSYWRAARGPHSWIVMDAPPGLEDIGPWLRMRELLASGGVRVPQVLARDLEAGFLLLEDLGARTLLDEITSQSAEAWFDAAIDQLLLIQAIPCPADLPAYDEGLLRRELSLFDEWYLDRHLGIELDRGDRARLQAGHDALVQAALDQPRVLVHRDFMPRNLMPVEGGLAVLDFQDAVRGPIAYDPVCLFKDAFVSWPEALVGRWLEQYRSRAEQAGLPVPDTRRFRRDVDLIGVQRHLKVLGIFARLRYRDDKPRYLTDAPRFLAYLEAVLPRHAELQPLAELFAHTLRPALTALEGP